MVVTRAAFDHLAACHPLSGVREPWDAVLVVDRQPDLLVALIDAVGQGDSARAAVTRARDLAALHLADSVAGTFQAVHEAVGGTKGVSLGVARIRPGAGVMEFTGMGRVYGAVAGRAERVFASDSGTLGVGLHHMPATTSFRYQAGDTLVLAADGQVDTWDLRPLWRHRTDPLPELLARLEAAGGRAPEDASIVLARAW